MLAEENPGRDYTAVVSFPQVHERRRTGADGLREAGVPEDAFTVVLDAETVISRRFDQLVEQYGEDDSPE